MVVLPPLSGCGNSTSRSHGQGNQQERIYRGPSMLSFRVYEYVIYPLFSPFVVVVVVVVMVVPGFELKGDEVLQGTRIQKINEMGKFRYRLPLFFKFALPSSNDTISNLISDPYPSYPSVFKC